MITNSLNPFTMIIKLFKAIPKIDKETGERKLDKHGKPRTNFIYIVKGTKDELDEYLSIQCERSGLEAKAFTGDNGEMLYFTEYALPFDTGKLLITSNGNVVVDNSAVAVADSLITQFPGPVGVMLAKQWLAQNKQVEIPDLTENAE